MEMIPLAAALGEHLRRLQEYPSYIPARADTYVRVSATLGPVYIITLFPNDVFLRQKFRIMQAVGESWK